MKKQDAAAVDLSFLRTYSIWEDDIYFRLDKLHALCAAKSLLYENSTAPDPTVCFHYTKVLEEQVIELRKLMDDLFKYSY